MSTLNYFDYANDLFSAKDYVEDQKENLWTSWTTDPREVFGSKLRIAIEDVESLKNHRPELNCSVEYQLGKVDGYTELFEQLFRTEEQKRSAANILAQQSPKAQKVLQCLYREGSMRHGDLAAAVDSSYSSLTNIMKKVLLSGAVESARSGKNTYYRLTDVGRQYCKQQTAAKKGELSELIRSIVAEVGRQWERLEMQSQLQKSGSGQFYLRTGESFNASINDGPLEKMKIDGFVMEMQNNVKYVAMSNMEEKDSARSPLETLLTSVG